MYKNDRNIKDLEFIKEFSKMSISSICRELNINRGNLLNGKTTDYNILMVKNHIIFRFNELVEKNSKL